MLLPLSPSFITMTLSRIQRIFFSLLMSVLSAPAATLNATYNTASDVPLTASAYTATGNTVEFSLNCAPATGTNLTVVKNTGLGFIDGTFNPLVVTGAPAILVRAA